MCAAPTKIILIRHGEKPGEPPPPHGITPEGEHDPASLSVRGWLRAGALMAFFAPTAGQFSHPLLATPNVIYAARIAPGSESRRHQQTVTPLLEKLGDRALANLNFAKGEEEPLMASALEQAGVVLVCWEHGRLPAAAQRVPLSRKNTTPIPDEWDPERFDLVWVLDLDPENGGYVFNQFGQHLLPGDADA